MAIAAVPVRPRLRVQINHPMIIDLRSDTVTRPTPEMLEFMFQTKVGDDVFDEDPSVNHLQKLTADLFGMEAALFCPTGTMANQIAIKVQTQPGDEVICDSGSHIHYYEGGGIAFNSGASTKTLEGVRGVFNANQLAGALRPTNIHFPRTSLVSIENTCNRGGGKVFGFETITSIREVCDRHKLKLHLDGARLFNAMEKEGTAPKEFGKTFDTISICLSKGLGAPMGSVLLGSRATINQAKRIRKVLGGGMRQAGYMAAAGVYALSHNINRLKKDHELATSIEATLNATKYVEDVLPVETNIVVFQLTEGVNTSYFLEHLKNDSIHAFEVGKNKVRFVTHLNLPPSTLQTLEKSLKSYSSF